jgi:cysteinyl-tRNA synthetase
VISGDPVHGRSHVDEILKAGFDGIYLDWIEAFSDENVIEAAVAAGVDTAPAMLQFLEEIRDHARYQSAYANPRFLLVAQNAPDLYPTDPARYRGVIDAIAMEAVWFDGDGGFDDWSDPAGYNVPTNSLYPGWTEEVLGYLTQLVQHMPVFVAEYAQDVGQETRATEVYTQLAPERGFVPYCTRRSLARLSSTPYPLGYEPLDY